MHKVIWDTIKAAANFKKHGVRFSDASTVLDDPLGLTVGDHRHDEQRFVTIGSDLEGRVLVVVYSYANSSTVRLISARAAEPSERRQYAEKA